MQLCNQKYNSPFFNAPAICHDSRSSEFCVRKFTITSHLRVASSIIFHEVYYSTYVDHGRPWTESPSCSGIRVLWWRTLQQSHICWRTLARSTAIPTVGGLYAKAKISTRMGPIVERNRRTHSTNQCWGRYLLTCMYSHFWWMSEDWTMLLATRPLDWCNSDFWR